MARSRSAFLPSVTNFMGGLPTRDPPPSRPREPGADLRLSEGALPAGLDLNDLIGAITGTPTESGPSTFTITADNGLTPVVAAAHGVTTSAAQPELPPFTPAVPLVPPMVATVPLPEREIALGATRSDVGLSLAGATFLLMAGGMLLVIHRARRRPLR